MNVSVNPVGFSEINTAVLYTFSTYIPLPEDKGNFSSPGEIINSFPKGECYWRGSDDGLSMNDLLEYDLRYNIDKRSFATTILPNLYTVDTKNILSPKGVIEQIKNIVPGIFSSGESEAERWFGSTLIVDKTVMVIPAKENIWRIELYEEAGIESNCKEGGFIPSSILDIFREDSLIYHPAVTISIGPDPMNRNNSTDWYLEGDSRKQPGNRVQSSIRDWVKQVEEITADKAVVIAMSQNSSSPEVNLALKAWNLSPNPLRNLDHWMLRNDKFYSLRSNLKVVEETEEGSGMYKDSRSGTILGTTEVINTNSPILNKKIDWVNKLTEFRTQYSPYKCYELRDTVTYNNQLWESISPRNIGNIPTLSPGKWALADKLDSMFTSRIAVSSEEGGSINPGGTVTIIEPEEHHIFEVLEDLGHKLNPDHPAYTFPGRYITNFSITEDLEDQRVVKKIDVWGWEDAIENGKITFCFIEEGCTIRLKLELKSTDYSISEWEEVFKDSGVSLETIYLQRLDNSNIYRFEDIEGVTTAQDIPINQKYELIFPYIEEIQPEKMKMENSVLDSSVSLEVLPTLSEEGWKFPITTDFSTSFLTIQLIARLLEIVASGTGFEFSIPKSQISYGTSGYYLEFYSLDSSLLSKDWIVTINDREIPFGGKLEFRDTIIEYNYDSFRQLFFLKWEGEIKESYTIKVTKK